MFGHCLIRIVHYILALRREHPHKRIFMSKVDYKSAYRKSHLNWETAIQSMTQLNGYLIATFGGTSCLYNWITISEAIMDLANMLLNNPEWNASTLRSSLWHSIPKDATLPDDITFAQALPAVVSPLVGCCSKADVYIDNTTTITVDDSINLQRAQATVPLAIQFLGRPLSQDELIPRKYLISENKLIAGWALEEIKVDLGRLFGTRRLLVSLPDKKYTAWSRSMHTIIKKGWIDHDEFDTRIGWCTHIAVVLKAILLFLSRLHSLKFIATPRRQVKALPKKWTTSNLLSASSNMQTKD